MSRRTSRAPQADRPFGVPDWPAMSPEVRQIADLKPHPKNPHTHPDSQIDALGAAFEEFSITSLPVVDERGTILAGHARIEAARKRGYTEFPVIVVRGWSEQKKLAFVIGDNRLQELAGYDDKLLREGLEALKASGNFNFQAIGFDMPSLEELLAGAPAETRGDPDEAPEPKKDPAVRKGDLWLLGKHRILCGSSTIADDVARLAGDDRASMVFTDPPYGVAYRDTGAGAWNAEKLAKKKAGTLKPRFAAIENDDLDEAELLTFLVDYMKVQPLAKGAAQYVCHASLRAHVFREALVQTGYAIRAELIWAKSRPGFNFAHYKHKHEPIYYAVPIKGGKVGWYGDMTQTTLWEVASESGQTYEHPTQKPVGLPLIAIKNSSRAGQFVYEPFSGSGSTLIACEMMGRRCLAVELDPAYVQVAIERWEKLAGKKATLDGTDKTLELIAKDRKRGRATGGKNAKGNSGVTIRRKRPARPVQDVA